MYHYPTSSMLPKPLVLEGVEGKLGLAHTPAAGMTIEIAAYPGMSAGDVVRLNWLGRAADATPYSYIESRDVLSSDINRRVRFVVPKNLLDRLAGGSLTLSYSVIAAMKAELTSPELTLEVMAG
jgi:hypothetical protein